MAAANEETFKAPIAMPSARSSIRTPEMESHEKKVEGEMLAADDGVGDGSDDEVGSENATTAEAGEGQAAAEKNDNSLRDEDRVVLPPGIAYSVPEWSGRCSSGAYTLEVLKNGIIIDTLDLCSRPLHILGRLPTCHITMDHPSLSRFHAVLQFNARPDVAGRPSGWYLFDLDSTHGTWVNKVKVRPMEFHRVRVGHVMKFGGSTRLYIVQGPLEDREAEAALSYSQMKEQQEKAKAEATALRDAQTAAAERRRVEAANRALVQSSCSWGFNEDAEEEEEEGEMSGLELSAEPKHEDQYRKDPKKALRAYFEREGYDVPEFEFLDAGFNKHHCRVELTPLQVSSGRPTYAEAIISGGKKKEAVVACALEACRLLDRMGELHKAATSRAVRRRRDWEANEFYDSDEDTFLDRTGDIERKRAKRMALAGKPVEEVRESADGSGAASTDRPDTFESLTAKWAKLMADIHEVEEKLNNAKKELAGGDRPAESELDALDAYMAAIKAGALDRRTRMALRMQLTQMRQQKELLRRRLQAAAPSLSQLAMRQGPKVPPAVQGPTVGPSEEMEEDKKEEKSSSVSAEDMTTNIAKPATGRMRFTLRKPSSAVKMRIVAPVNFEALDAKTAHPEEEEEDEEEEEEEDKEEEDEEEEEDKEEEDEEEKKEKNESAGRGRKEEDRLSVKSAEATASSLETTSMIDIPDSAQLSTPSALPAGRIGPSMPPTESSPPPEENIKKKRRRRHRKGAHYKVPGEEGQDEEEEEDVKDDSDYVSWIPPADQTGDGRTALNEKFGY